MNKNEFIFLPLWWQTFASKVLVLRRLVGDAAYLCLYELQGFVEALFLAGVIDQTAAHHMRELVRNAHSYGDGVEALLARHAA